MDFKLEHIAFNVRHMDTFVDWYIDNLGLKPVLREKGGRAFLADATGRTIFELYSNPTQAFIEDYHPQPLTLHNAFAVKDINSAVAALVKAGATQTGEIAANDDGDKLCMLSDPWGIGLQIVARKKAMP